MRKEFLGFFLGVLWFLLLIYFRFIKERTGYDLISLKNSLSENIILFNIAFILLHLCLILYMIYKIMAKVSAKKSKNRFIKFLLDSYNELIMKPLESAREYLAPHIPGSGILFIKICNFLEKNDNFYPKILVIFFCFLPRIILSIIFFVELLFYQKIHYFIYSLSLLFFTLFWSIFVDLFTSFGARILKNLPEYIKITPLGEPLPNGWHSNYSFAPLPQYRYEKDDMKEYADTWYIALKIYAFGETYFKGFQNKLSPYVTLLTSLLYLIASIFKLFFLIV